MEQAAQTQVPAQQGMDPYAIASQHVREDNHFADLGYTGGPMMGVQGSENQQQQTPESPANTQSAAVQPNGQQPPQEVKKPAFESFTKAPTTERPWDDNSKALFKERGIDDPDNFFKEHGVLKEQYRQLQEKNRTDSELVESFSKLPEVAQHMVRKMFKGENVFQWAREQGALDLTKEAAKHDKVDLVEQYAPDVFTKEQLNVLRNPDDHDPEVVNTLKNMLKPALNIATAAYNQKREGLVAEHAKELKDRETSIENLRKSYAANMAYVREKHPEFVADMTNERMNDFFSGKSIQDHFYQADGTPKPEAYAQFETLRNLPGILQSVREVSMEAGRQEERARVMQRHPNAPAFGAERGLQPLKGDEKKQQDHLNDLKPL